MRLRITRMRRLLSDALESRLPNLDTSFLTNQEGMFSFTGLSLVQVVFDEPIEVATATNVNNYVLNNAALVLGAAFGSTPREVLLTTSVLSPGANYTLTVNNIRDVAAARNTVLPNSQHSFVPLLKGSFREIFTDIIGVNLIDLTTSPTFPAAPTISELHVASLETPEFVLNNYGQRLRARILPPVTGSYVFGITAQDSVRARPSGG